MISSHVSASIDNDSSVRVCDVLVVCAAKIIIAVSCFIFPVCSFVSLPFVCVPTLCSHSIRFYFTSNVYISESSLLQTSLNPASIYTLRLLSTGFWF